MANVGALQVGFGFERPSLVLLNTMMSRMRAFLWCAEWSGPFYALALMQL